MKLEDQVCSLELAKQLKELGVKQDSYFKWEERSGGHVELFHSKATSCAHEYYSAFTLAELGEMLPAGMSPNKSENNVYYFTIGEKLFGCKNEAKARAKILIYLIENNIIKVEDINNAIA